MTTSTWMLPDDVRPLLFNYDSFNGENFYECLKIQIGVYAIQYDKNMFNYVDNIYFIPEKFKQFVEDLPLLVLDDTYTLDFLSYLDNKKELVYPYLDIEFSLDVIDRLKDKYNLEDSNHLVDLIYESLIFNTK